MHNKDDAMDLDDTNSPPPAGEDLQQDPPNVMASATLDDLLDEQPDQEAIAAYNAQEQRLLEDPELLDLDKYDYGQTVPEDTTQQDLFTELDREAELLEAKIASSTFNDRHDGDLSSAQIPANVGDEQSTDIPDLTHGNWYDMPEIRAVYDAYHQAYSDPSATMSSHLERAKVLAHTLLKHYFPFSQGFTVEPESFKLMNKFGWSITTTRISEMRAAAKNKKKKKGAVKDEVDFVPPDGGSDTEPDPHPAYPKSHHIPPDCIAGFVVKTIYTMRDKDGVAYEQSFPHTYLAIMVDKLKGHSRWQQHKDALNPPSDIMAYSLDGHAKIKKGYGILMLGKRLEFYKFDDNSDSKKADKTPSTTPYTIETRVGNEMIKRTLAFDMSREDPVVVAQAFEQVVTGSVFYQNGVVGTGSKKAAA